MCNTVTTDRHVLDLPARAPFAAAAGLVWGPYTWGSYRWTTLRVRVWTPSWWNQVILSTPRELQTPEEPAMRHPDFSSPGRERRREWGEVGRMWMWLQWSQDMTGMEAEGTEACSIKQTKNKSAHITRHTQMHINMRLGSWTFTKCHSLSNNWLKRIYVFY